MHRRRVLGALGGSAAMGLAGCVFPNPLDDESGNGGDDSRQKTDEQPEPSFHVTDATVLEAADGQSVTVGTPADIVAFVQNSGDRGEGTIELTVGEIQLTRQVVLGRNDEVGIRFENLSTDTLGVGEHEYTISASGDGVTRSLQVEPAVPAGEFVATSTDGWVWLGEQDRSDFSGFDVPLLSEFVPIPLPPSDLAEQPVELTGTVDGDQWESTQADFPQIVPLPHDVETPEGLSGVFDPERGRFTLTGPIAISLPEDDSPTLTVPVSATTEASGDLLGAFERDGNTLTVTVVDNEFTLDENEPGLDFLTEELGIGDAVQEPGANWFSLTLELTLGSGL